VQQAQLETNSQSSDPRRIKLSTQHDFRVTFCRPKSTKFI